MIHYIKIAYFTEQLFLLFFFHYNDDDDMHQSTIAID